MDENSIIVLTNHEGRKLRLTSERQDHILEHPEIRDQIGLIQETIKSPETIVASDTDPTVLVYHRYFESTPVTSKFLLVVVKMLVDDAFILTAFFSRREKKGTVIWTT